MRRTAAIVVVLLVASLGVPTAASGGVGAKTFRFFGSAWGHGIGLSQYGAYGLAVKGWGHKRILTHFYSHTRVTGSPIHPKRVRVGLLQGRRQVKVAAQSGPVQLRVGSPHGTLAGTIPSGATWRIGIRNAKYRIVNGNGKLVGGHTWGGPAKHLFARYVGAGALVYLPATGHRYGRGFIEFNIYGPSGRRVLRLVAVVPPQEYLYGLGEVPSSWPAAALRAQAVAARTYAFEKIARLGQHRDLCNCAVYASTIDQAYIGWDKEADADGGRWKRAVRDTSGQTVLYRGKLIQAFYHSSSGGYTENNENVWGGSPLPYLRGVCDPGDYTAANPNRVWRVDMTGRRIGNRLAAYTGTDVGDVRRFTGIDRGVSGRIIAAKVVGTKGSMRVSGATLRSALGLLESKVWINQNRNVVTPLREKYDRLNCRPGLPAGGRAKVPGGLRQRFANGGLYRNVSRDRTYWVHGPIYGEYVDRHESAGVLGMPRSDVDRLKRVGCKRKTCTTVRFEKGAGYFKTGLGPHEVFGRVFAFFWSHGGTRRFGFPTSDTRRKPNGAQVQTFERGTIRCPEGGTCHRIG